MSRYRIPKQRSRVEIRVSNSRFITTIGPAFSVKEAQGFVRAIRAEMPDASHHVYAFKIGYGASVSEGLSDDGEPNGTAGPPTMAVLRGADLGDVVLVTTRYFGGTKLGTGGLVTAYTEAAKAGLAVLETEEKVIRVRYEVDVPYKLLESARRLLAEYECVLEGESFEADVRVRFLIAEERVEELGQRLSDLSAGRVTPIRVD